MMSQESRGRKLFQILEQIEEDITSYFEEESFIQNEFNQFALDQRYIAGTIFLENSQKISK